MQAISVVLSVLHVLSGVFWVGSTFALMRMSGNQAAALFRTQMGAAAIAILSGASLWFLFHRGSAGTQEQVLGIGAILAVIAVAIQRLTHRSAEIDVAGAGEPAIVSQRAVLGQRLAAACLAVTVACMAASRYV